MPAAAVETVPPPKLTVRDICRALDAANIAHTPATGRAALQRFGKELNACIVRAIEDAKARQEFVAWMPVEDVALQLVSIANSAGPITQDAGDFDRLEQLYAAFTRIMTHAFGQDACINSSHAVMRLRNRFEQGGRLVGRVRVQCDHHAARIARLDGNDDR